MEPQLLRVHFPKGAIPVRGFECPVCHEQRILASEAERAQELARQLGLFGLEDAQVRKLIRTGNSVAVSLAPGLVRDVLKGIKPGQGVRVGREGSRIVIERA